MQIISRKEAKVQGLKHYFTGVACKRGHVNERYVSTGNCVDCLSIVKIGRIPVRKLKKADTIFITRAEAISLGFDKYQTGLPCAHNHLSERYVSTGTCVECQKLRRLVNLKDADYRKRKLKNQRLRYKELRKDPAVREKHRQHCARQYAKRREAMQ